MIAHYPQEGRLGTNLTMGERLTMDIGRLSRFSILGVGILIFGAGCQTFSLRPKITHHPEPEAAMDFSPFENAGCPPDRWGQPKCQPDSQLWKLGCPRLEAPSPPNLGNLEPDYPLMLCVFNPYDDRGKPIRQLWEEGETIKERGGLDPLYYRYVIYKDGQFVLLKTQDEFKETFAPVESREEALSYALALTDLEAMYRLEYDSSLEYFVTELEDTHVQEIEGGYEVHLYEYYELGCGPHPTALVIVRVGAEGSLEEISRTQVYKNPADDELCID